MQTLDFPLTKAERVLQQVFLLAVFFVPHSTVFTNVFVGLTYLALLPALYSNRSMLQGARFTPVFIVLALYLLLLLGTTWTIAPANEMRNALFKYTKLFLIPIGMMLSYRDPAMLRRMLTYFMFGTGVLLLGGYLTAVDLMPRSSRGWWSVGTPDNPVAFKNYITFGILTVFSSMICFAYYRYAATTRGRLAALALGAAFAIPPAFLNQGRTGYIVLLVGVLMLAYARFRNNWKLLLMCVAAAAIAAGGVYASSKTLKSRTEKLAAEIHDYANADMHKSTGVNFADTNEENSSGIRLNFYRAGAMMIAQHPILGLGTGSFQEGFAPTSRKLWPEGHPKRDARHQPHSEVIMLGVQLGLVGIGLYLALLGSIAWQANKSRGYASDVTLILLAIFFVAALFNSLIWDFTEGYWLCLLSGVLYGYLRRNQAVSTSTQQAYPAGATHQVQL